MGQVASLITLIQVNGAHENGYLTLLICKGQRPWQIHGKKFTRHEEAIASKSFYSSHLGKFVGGGFISCAIALLSLKLCRTNFILNVVYLQIYVYY